MAYSGAERRVHNVFVTRNTEYHTRKYHVVAVRDRKSGEWLRGHQASGYAVTGGLKFHSNGGVTPNIGVPSVGDSILLQRGEGELITSALISVERPPREVIKAY